MPNTEVNPPNDPADLIARVTRDSPGQPGLSFLIEAP